MIAGIMFAVLAALIPAAYLLGRHVASERAIRRMLDQVLDPQMDLAEFIASLRQVEGEPWTGR